MKIIRYRDPEGSIRYAAQQPDGSAVRIEGDIFHGYSVTSEPAKISKLLTPVHPVQILGTGLNYRRHAEETNAKIPERPILFTKGVNCACAPGDPILLPTHAPSHEVDYECELAVVIGRDCKNATVENALSYVLGYTCANDVSARDWQIKYNAGQWTRGKYFDTFCPMGPCLVTKDEIPDPQTLGIRTRLNGQIMQDSHTGDMIFTVAQIITFFSASTTLPAGTVILTGTPEGVGMARKPPVWLKPGDEVTIEIDRIGSLTNPVRLEG